MTLYVNSEYLIERADQFLKSDPTNIPQELWALVEGLRDAVIERDEALKRCRSTINKQRSDRRAKLAEEYKAARNGVAREMDALRIDAAEAERIIDGFVQQAQWANYRAEHLAELNRTIYQRLSHTEAKDQAAVAAALAGPDGRGEQPPVQDELDVAAAKAAIKEIAKGQLVSGDELRERLDGKAQSTLR